TVLLGAGLDSSALLLVAILPLAGSIVLTALSDMRGAVGAARPQAASTPAAGGHAGVLPLLLHHPYLLAVAGGALFPAWVSTNGENLLFKVVQEALATRLAASGVTNSIEMKSFVRDWATAFYGNFFFWVNASALVLQAVFASRLLRYGGFGLILLLLPVISLLTYSTMAIVPVLAVVSVMKTAENSTAYSINNTARQVLWLPPTAEMKYKVKPAIETFLVRLGDGLAAATILFGIHFFALTTVGFFMVNVALVLVWLAIAVEVVREHRHLLPPGGEGRS